MKGKKKKPFRCWESQSGSVRTVNNMFRAQMIENNRHLLTWRHKPYDSLTNPYDMQYRYNQRLRDSFTFRRWVTNWINIE